MLLRIIKWRPKTLYNAILPIMILNWFTGLSLIEYPLCKPQLTLSFVYVFLNFSAYCYANFYDPSKNIPNRNEIRKTVFHLLEYANFFISACCILIGWYYYKAYRTIIKRLELLDDALETLGISNNYRKIFINSLLKAIMWVFMTGTLIIIDIHFLSQIFGFFKCLHLCYLFHYPIQLNSVADFTFTSIVSCIGLKFDSINLHLKRILSRDPKPKTVSNRISVLIMSAEHSDIFNNTERQKKLIILIKLLHLELTKISVQVNKIYQTQIMMAMITFLASMAGLLYILFSMLFLVDKRFAENSRIIMSVVGWCAFYIYRLLNVNCTCGRVSSELEQFSLQLTQRPLSFTVWGFTTLDYPLIQKFIETLSTYLVVLIHFSPEIKR